MARRLTRALDGGPAAPVRIVHVGLGNFFRAHQAWYTENATDAADWGCAAFTGRTLGVAADLQAQEGLYTLATQGAEGTTYQVISSVVATHSGTDVAQLLEYFASPELAIVTSTVTEAGYVRDAAGGIDAANPAVVADLLALREGRLIDVTTAPGRFVGGLITRRAHGLGGLTFCPCDNVPDNGDMVAAVVRGLAALVDPELVDYIDAEVGFVTTMVDRITPRPTEATREAVLADTGIDDPACVATEPFAQWVLAGEFVAGRPAWETGGAQFVDDIVPYEQLKLWMLNGAHTLMAYAGPILGKQTVFEAMSDPVIAGWVNDWWDIAQRHLPLPKDTVDAYRRALEERFLNPNIQHLLAQIAADGSQKVPIRLTPALIAERAVDGDPTGAERAVAAWTLHLRGLGAPVTDAHADVVAPLGRGTLEESVAGVSNYLGLTDASTRAAVLRLALELEARAA